MPLLRTLIFLALATGLAAQDKIQTLILTGQNVPGHDWRRVTPLLREALEATGRFEVRVNEDFRGGTSATLAPYDLVVVNYYDLRKPDWRWGEIAEKALVQWVESGKGLVLYHFSLAAFDGWTEFEEMSGGNWRPNQGHHSPPHDFEVVIRDPHHPITDGMRTKFLQPLDELYANLKWQPRERYRILATAWDDHKLYQGKSRQPVPGDGLDHPMLWVSERGKGRIFVTALGHDPAAVQTPAFTATFTRGSEWAATNCVTIPVPAQLALDGAGETAVPPGASSRKPPAAVSHH